MNINNINDIIKLIMAFVGCVSAFIFVKNILNVLTSNTNESLYKKRLKQLQFNQKRSSSDDMDMQRLVETITSPVAKHLIPKLNLTTDKAQLDRDLEMAQWNKIFTSITFIAMNLTLKIVGVIVLIILGQKSMAFGLVWFVALFFGFKLLFNNAKNERAFRLLCEFPDLIRITQGFLMSNMPLPEAFENTVPYIGKEWSPIIREFVINSEIYSQEECIDIISSKVDIFEVRELWSLIKLNAEQGIDIKECFTNQAEKVRTMQLEVMLNKIGKREMYSIAIQGPLLLSMIVGFGLPTLYSMTHLGV